MDRCSMDSDHVEIKNDHDHDVRHGTYHVCKGHLDLDIELGIYSSPPPISIPGPTLVSARARATPPLRVKRAPSAAPPRLRGI